MLKVKDANQLNIFDPWAFLTPKRRQLLDAGWPGLFRKHSLPSLPVHQVAKYFDETLGRPTKELFAMLGALILQQTLDLTDEQTVRQYAFDTHWHYALNISGCHLHGAQGARLPGSNPGNFLLLHIMPSGALFFVCQRTIEDN